jgi:hypothetical protein
VGALASSRLRSLAQGDVTAPGAATAADADERCDLCGRPIPAEHRHLVDVETGRLMCACPPCSLLFDGAAAGGGHFKLVPDRRLRLDDFDLPEPVWDAFRIPVEMAYFFRGSREGRVRAFYPSPMGPTESLLGLDAWDALARRNPLLESMSDDVEALLVNRARGARGAFLVPIEDCFALVATIRTHWRGFTGGAEVWQEIDRFFERLGARSRPDGGKEPTWPR